MEPAETRCVFCVQMMGNVLDNPNEPVSDLSYFESLDAVMDKSKVTLELSDDYAAGVGEWWWWWWWWWLGTNCNDGDWGQNVMVMMMVMMVTGDKK